MRHIYKIAFLFLLIPTLVIANNGMDGKHTKTKTINKEFSVSSSATVNLDNRYGSIDIKTWDQNKVTLEIIVTTNSDNESKAQDRLDDIQILFEDSKSLVLVKTQIGKSNKNWNWGNKNNVNMDIQYIVRMPTSNNLIVDMDYGDVMLNKLEGESDFNCDYGKLLVGELLNDSNQINLDYSNGSTIDYLKNGDINIDYSNIEIEKSGNISLNSDYSNTTFQSVNNIDFNCDYGNITIDNANEIRGNSDYANLKFGKIASKLTVDADYGNLKIEEMGVNFSYVDINTEYIGVKIGVHKNSSFRFTAYSKYGGINVPDNMDITKKIEKNTSKEFEGTYNGTKGQINVTTQYGSIKIIEK